MARCSRRWPQRGSRQRGAAIITALLVVTLAVVIVSGMLWRQQVEIRAVENQRLKAQATWIARAGIDWARLILRDDQRRTGAVDHLGEVWAVPIQETKLSDFLGSSLRTDTAGEASYLSGRIFDAQARFNLMNLLTMQTLGARTVVTARDKDGIKAYGLLLQSLNIDPSLANVTATYLAQMMGGFQSVEGSQGGQPGGEDSGGGSEASNGPRPLDSVDSLLTIPGYTADIVRKLRPYVIVLPTRTPINANTASAEVLAAVIPNLGLDRARALVQARDRAYFRNIGDVTNQLRGIAPGADTTAAANLLDVQTHYFLVYGMARHERAQIGEVALVSRGDPVNNTATRIVWVRRIDEIPS
ncbi:Type II secretion system protein K [Ralstonia mannitolilytica]|uniref:type II secretion system minor pseudopilin GspK n=1 Tax=Ralstonia mannitolilytica TaxID=105219 RepID=UPI000BBCFA1D|nr:type II secretion system minor pseudopilin GspK [Ralstonia mannitolilytica]ATG18621.1 general secretion pathway protein GspK [Ralstonia pickettii]CAJ0739387.1 Type II secretion system protein K [Ralstonia mannitolilytica]CAJ0804494.1 Type II secretion system protein K [Ralstonia mannitolilytica]